MTPTSLPGLGRGRVAATGNTTVDWGSIGLIIDCSGTFALNFVAAATLGSQFQVAAYCTSGAVTLTANGAETIQSPAGSANTFVLNPGQGCWVSCDGTGLKIVLGAGLAPSPSGTITTDTIRAATTAGILLRNSAGTQVMSVGLTGTGVTFAGAVTANGGTVQIGTADINGGAIDGTAIGATSPSTVVATALTATGLTPGNIPYVSTGGLLADSTRLKWDNSNRVLTVGDGAGAADIVFDSLGATAANFFFRSAGVNRFIVQKTDTVLTILARNDAGGSIDSPLTIVRAAGGSVTIARPTTINGNLTLGSGNNLAMSGASTATFGTGVVSMPGTTASTTVSNGALVVGGGLGVNGKINAINAQFSQSLNGIQEVLASNASAGASAFAQVVVQSDAGRRAYFGVTGSGNSALGGANTAYIGANSTVYLVASDAVRASLSSTALTLASGINLAMSGASTFTSGTGLCTFNGAIRVNNAAVAATPTATHTITIQDSTGTTYRIPCVV